eukprot:sb/3474974/
MGFVCGHLGLFAYATAYRPYWHRGIRQRFSSQTDDFFADFKKKIGNANQQRNRKSTENNKLPTHLHTLNLPLSAHLSRKSTSSILTRTTLLLVPRSVTLFVFLTNLCGRFVQNLPNLCRKTSRRGEYKRGE